MTVTLDKLCTELKFLVLSYLDVDELLNFSLVSKTWYHLISSDAVWSEKFRLLEVKDGPPDPPVVEPVIRRTSPRRKPAPVRHEKEVKPASAPEDGDKGDSEELDEFRSNVTATVLTAEQLNQIKARKFFSIYERKLAFFLNKKDMIFTRLHVKKEVTMNPYHDFSYYGEAKEFLQWSHWDENDLYVTKLKIFEQRDTTRYNLVHLLYYNLPNQWIDAGVQYVCFRSVGDFCLAQVREANMIHVYRFSYESGLYEKKHELQPVEKANLNGESHVFTESAVTFCGSRFLCHYDLYTGENITQVALSNVLKTGETLSQIQNAGKSRILLIIKYHTKKYIQEKVALVNMSTGEVLWETKLNCLSSFMKLGISGKYFVVLKNKKTDDFQLSFTVYDLETGSKEYDIPFHPEYLDLKEWYLPPNRDILIVRCTEEDFFFDLVAGEEIEVTLDIKKPKPVARHISDSDDSDVDVNSSTSSSESNDFDLSVSYYEKGPGDSVLLHVLYNYDHEMAIYMLDYRKNRYVLVAKLEGQKMERTNLHWDKQFRHLVECYDYHICSTSVYRVW